MGTNGSVARCSGCRLPLQKHERGRLLRICNRCKAAIHAAWKADRDAIMAPDWPATVAADLRASKAVRQ